MLKLTYQVKKGDCHMDFKKLDPELWQAIANEEQRQQNNIELIASENIVSKNVLIPSSNGVRNATTAFHMVCIFSEIQSITLLIMM